MKIVVTASQYEHVVNNIFRFLTADVFVGEYNIACSMHRYSNVLILAIFE